MHPVVELSQKRDVQSVQLPDLGSEIFGAPIDCLPEPLPSDSRFGVTGEDTTSLPGGVPIQAMMGDSHAALYGHGIRAPGKVKATYGTGSSLMTLTPERTSSQHGLSGTIAWTQGGKTSYALEGNITVSAQAAVFATDVEAQGRCGTSSEIKLHVSGHVIDADRADCPRLNQRLRRAGRY